MLPANWLTEVIKVAAFAAVALSFYFVFWPRIRIILGKEEDSGLRSLDLMAGYKASATTNLSVIPDKLRTCELRRGADSMTATHDGSGRWR